MALRHTPEKLGLTLSAEGWVTITDLLKGLTEFNENWKTVTVADLEQMDVESGKQRFEIDGDKIRALYGHSTTETQIEYEPVQPPATLYHGTSAAAAKLIIEEGLKPMGRQYVHLSDEKEIALIVGKRKEKNPVLFIVDAKSASEAGITFYHGNDNTWLANALPAKFLTEAK
jgi:putative RNA 2'-phosphotransferase